MRMTPELTFRARVDKLLKRLHMNRRQFSERYHIADLRRWERRPTPSVNAVAWIGLIEKDPWGIGNILNNAEGFAPPKGFTLDQLLDGSALESYAEFGHA